MPPTHVAAKVWCCGDSTTNDADAGWSWRAYCPHETYGHLDLTWDAEFDGNTTHSGIHGQSVAAWAAPYTPPKSGWAGIMTWQATNISPTPEALVLVAGANDIDQYRTQVNDDAQLRSIIIAGYHDTIDDFLAKHPGVPVVLAQIPPFRSEQTADNAVIADLFDDVAAETWPSEVDLVDLHTNFPTDGHRDAIHWNDKGNAFVGVEIAKKLDEVLGL